LVRCANPEAEAITAARAVVQFVRQEHGRYREAAVLVRALDRYQAVLRRVFARYGVPIFLDRRERVAHHPLTELTRSALRLVAFGWRTEDWMGVLKTGLAGGDESEIDALENAALAAGWEGETWLHPLPRTQQSHPATSLEPLRCALVGPFVALSRQLDAGRGTVAGAQLAEALRQLWDDLNVGVTLGAWAEVEPTITGGHLPPVSGARHLTVWQDLGALLNNLALAFKDEAMTLREWLPILESGLSDLTVGVVPPALDQVLVGAIDRSRNPDLRLVVLLGWNDGVFPAPLGALPLLTETERRELEQRGMPLGPDRRRRIGRERYYAYIACTRARQRVVVTFAERDSHDGPLNPSPFVRHLHRLFPTLTEEMAVTRPGWSQVEHVGEATIPWLRLHQHGEAGTLGAGRTIVPPVNASELCERHRDLDLHEPLHPRLAERLYGPSRLRTSVSRIEQFAACPFRFLVHSGLRAEERRQFELDVRQTGSFQHEVLARFHAEVASGGLRWRDLTPGNARERVARIAASLVEEFADGLFQTEARRRFIAQTLGHSLEEFIGTMIAWMQQSYAFDPVAAELVFGASDAALPGWDVDLGDGHRLLVQGKIDRVDLARIAGEDTALCVVIDYKSSARKVDPLLQYHGIQIQLPIYLTALRALARQHPLFAAKSLTPVGVFYANLRGALQREPNRTDAATNRAEARRDGYCHRGRFSFDHVRFLDRWWEQPTGSGQFSYAAGGKLNRRYQDPLPATEFTALLDQVEQTVQAIGRQVFAGSAHVAPFVKGANETACQTCLYQSICRFDPWLHDFRRLPPLPAATTV
jgi:ATP-dependent helicase/nuclease subunit B